jgi:hypothetical protein
MSVKSITIQGHSFDATQPYLAGHVVTEAEAKALNQVRAENLRNNFASKIKSVQGEAEALTEEQLVQLRAEFATYDAEYVFTLASVGGGKRETDPVAAEAKKIAKQTISDKLKAAGKKVSDIAPETLANAIAKLAESENIQKLAKKAVAERQKAAQADLGELDLGL